MEKPTYDDKYKDIYKTNRVVNKFIDHFMTYGKRNNRNNQVGQPFIFYMDSRFSKLNIMKKMKEKGFYYVMSCSSNMNAKTLVEMSQKEF